MLLNLDPLLTGRLLRALDEMGHGDGVVIADAHFPASKLATKHPIEALVRKGVTPAAAA